MQTSPASRSVVTVRAVHYESDGVIDVRDAATAAQEIAEAMEALAPTRSGSIPRRSAVRAGRTHRCARASLSPLAARSDTRGFPIRLELTITVGGIEIGRSNKNQLG